MKLEEIEKTFQCQLNEFVFFGKTAIASQLLRPTGPQYYQSVRDFTLLTFNSTEINNSTQNIVAF